MAQDEREIYIEGFINDLMKGDIEIDYEKAKDLRLYSEIQKNIFGTEEMKDKKDFVSELGLGLTHYLQTKNTALHIKDTYHCTKLIIWAYTSQVVKRTGIREKLDNIMKENIQLKEENDKFRREIQRLNLLNKAMHETFDKLGFQRLDKDKGEE